MTYLLDTNIIIYLVRNFLGTTLVTTDNDFNHLKDEYLSVISVDALKHLDNINTITKLAESDTEDA
ncbi:MAG: hypothetical protein IPN94_08070 [Sphingobacteriales bacterium]|nr:hypothetical protein [Sphingobacteriales bacterium]